MSGIVKLPNGLTEKQFAFFNIIIEQLKTLGSMKPTQAAIQAGYSAKVAPTVSCRLLKSDVGKSYLNSLQKDSVSSATASLEWVMEKLISIAKLGIQEDGQPNYPAIQCSLKAISEINKIKGYYAPDKKVNLNMTMDDIQASRARELSIKYTREY